MTGAVLKVLVFSDLDC